MPIIIPFIIQTVLPVLSTIFTLLAPVLAAVLNFTLTRIPRIPLYLHLLNILYSDMNLSAKERKIITGGFLVIGSILTFMAYSLVPWTGLPLIGAVMSPIAATIAIVVVLTVLEIIFTINKGYYLQKLKRQGFAQIDDIEADINDLKNIFGNSWQKVQKTIYDANNKIYEEGSKRGINFNDKSYQSYLEHQLDGLNIYFSKTSVTEYQNINAALLKQNKGNDWTKDALSLGTGATVGTVAGVGASAVASSLFVPASLWTTIQGVFGVSTGIVVSASAYSLLTLAAPIGLGILATTGVYSGLKTWNSVEEATKKSKFLSEIMIAALPMAWIDGELSDKEQDAVDKLLTVSGIRKEERDVVWEAIQKRPTFDHIMRTSILFDDEHRNRTCSQSDDERLKHRLILCTAWKIAIADGKFEQSELQLHNRMADKLGISRSEVQEIRRVINLSLEEELSEVVDVIQPNGSKAKLLRSVREQYRLRPASDNIDPECV